MTVVVEINLGASYYVSVGAFQHGKVEIIANDQGERVKTKDNYLLGNFPLTNIPSALRGVPPIDLSIKLTINDDKNCMGNFLDDDQTKAEEMIESNQCKMNKMEDVCSSIITKLYID
ncbi:unnamed protein product [Rotaria socialis]|uniref:Uncharacterized protein n=1 Tax=Rotaria socialis TaxID=392032 RepID=A0A820MH33_9BILA|nr:unnamed protein product [Rotaria socialis]CAF4372691.1 unnamed protein product [Rotaria socialis]